MPTPFKKKFMRVPNLHFSSAIKEIGRNAFVDWLIIIAMSVCVTLGLSIIGFDLYTTVSSKLAQNTKISDSSQKKIFDEKDLDSVIMYFNGKKIINEPLKGGYRQNTDPSL